MIWNKRAFPPKSGRWLATRQLAILLFIVTLLGSCSMKWWYEQSDWIMLWKIDLYFDLDRNQSDKVESRIKDLLLQHRKQIIPEHIKFLKGVQKRAVDKLSDQEIEWFLAGIQQQIKVIVQHVVKDVAFFYSSLTPEQIQHYREEILEDNENIEEQLALASEKRRLKKAENITETLGDWFGGLSDVQERQFIRQLLTIPDTYEQWYRERLRRQRLFLQYLREHKGPKILEETLRDWFLIQTPKKWTANNPVIIKIFRNIDGMVTIKQRKHFRDKLQTWIDDFSSLTNHE